MKAETIAETFRLWQAAPDKARGKPAVNGRSDNEQAILESGSFAWRADLPPSVGGSGAAPSPTALLLSALAGCAVVFIVDTLAPQLGVQVDAVHAVAQCEADSRGLLGMPDDAPDATAYDPQYAEQLKGREAIKKDIEDFFTALPDIQASVNHTSSHLGGNHE